MTAWVHILPRDEPSFRQRGWQSPAPFLAWTGVLFNRHRDRQVACVSFDDEECFFLKKETNVCWRMRFRNAWQGFGWCSTAVREAKILQAVREAGIGCPEVVAYGEEDRQAFVLLREAAQMMELREFLPQLAGAAARQRLADALGRELAKMHGAGFDHPDLFAKHLLVAHEGASFRFCILDWQRTRQRRRVAWRQRCRDLAVLDATLHAALASDRLRLRCLRAYVRALPRRERPPLGRLARRIRRESAALRQKRKVREIGQLPVPPAQQQFVSLQQGRLLVVRSYYEELSGCLPDWLARLGEAESQAEASPVLWELPPLAHTLFRLHRFGITAPRLLAARYSVAHVALHLSPVTAIPFAEALEQASGEVRAVLWQQAGWIIAQIQEAGYRLPAEEKWTLHLGVDQDTETVMLMDVAVLHRSKADMPKRERQTS